MQDILDLGRHPVDRPDSAGYAALVERCRADLARDGMFNLGGFVRPEALQRAMETLRPRIATEAWMHAREHNIYFRSAVEGLAPDHPALRRFRTINRTLCADQLGSTFLNDLHVWPPFVDFLARVTEVERLHPMADPLARVNVMAYREGEALNWHFDRSEFTTTLLLQAPAVGGAFEYARNLRTADDPNYEGVGRLLNGLEPSRVMQLTPGTLNVFFGRNTAHRVTPVQGAVDRVIAVFSYFDRPGVTFSDEERIGFYGRAA